MALKTPSTTWLERFVSLDDLNRLQTKARQQNLGLRLPARFKQDVPFLDASLIQFFLTLDRWGIGNNPVLLPFIEKEKLPDFCRQLPVLALALTGLPVTFADGRNARPGLDRVAEKILQDYQSGGFEHLPKEFIADTRAVLFSCARGSLGQPGYFDLSDGSQVISRADFLNGQQAIFEQLFETRRASSRVTMRRQALLEMIGIVTHEFLTNAAKFALKELNGSSIPNGIRFLSYRVFSVTPKSTHDADHAIRRYIERQRLGGSRFLEISFCDNGPGLARHFLHNSEKMPEEDLEPDRLRGNAELGGTTTCFSRLRSGEKQISQGFGLNDVFDVLTDAHAFVRVRTGRLDLYRDLGSEPYRFKAEGPAVALNHMATESDDAHFTGWAWGTLYSVLLPWK